MANTVLVTATSFLDDLMTSPEGKGDGVRILKRLRSDLSDTTPDVPCDVKIVDTD